MDLQSTIQTFCVTFLMHLMSELGEEDTICVCPVSIHMALTTVCMETTYAPALKAFRQALKFKCDESIESIKQAYKQLTEQLSKHILLTSSFYTEVSLKEEFMKSFAHYYNGVCKSMPLSKDPKGCAEKINKQVEQYTNGMIKNLVSDRMLADRDAIYVNTVYLKADWVNPFNKNDTEDRDFTCGNGKKIMVKTMCQENVSLPYFKSEQLKVKVVALETKAKGLTAYFILPKKGESVNVAIVALPELQLNSNKMKKEEINLYLPRCRVETAFELDDTLKTCGFKDLYHCNLDKIRPATQFSTPFYVDSVVHRAVMDINEQGVECAAATCIICECAVVNPTVMFNRPYLCVVKDNQSDIPVFYGVINNPAAK